MILTPKAKTPDFSWFNYDDFSSSDAHRIELYCYLDNNEKAISQYEDTINKNRLIDFFKLFFLNSIDNIVIGQDTPDGIWGGFTTDVWKLNGDSFVFNSNGVLSEETNNYLNLLQESHISFDYKGFCTCSDYNIFLNIILDCVLKNIAPYSPLFYNISREIVLYFHHTYSVGIYYRNTILIDEIKRNAKIIGLEI